MKRVVAKSLGFYDDKETTRLSIVTEDGPIYIDLNRNQCALLAQELTAYVATLIRLHP